MAIMIKGEIEKFGENKKKIGEKRELFRVILTIDLMVKNRLNQIQ